jgi:hypothetical protein
MSTALAMVGMAAEPAEPYGRHLPPKIDRPPYTARELYAFFKGGEVEADRCEAFLASAARARCGIDLLVGEGLDALRSGERLPQLGYHLDDYGREALGMEERATRNLALLARELRTRPLLREAVRAGHVRLRAAQTVLPVAVGEAEPEWVERAASLTVRALEAAVRATGRAPDEVEEQWLDFRAEARPEEQALIDEALDLAARVLPGSRRVDQHEAICQEFLSELPGDPSLDGTRKLSTAFRPLGPSTLGPGSSGPGSIARQAALEAETDRWAMLPPVPDWPAPEVSFGPEDSAIAIDEKLRELSRLRAGWDDVIGFCARAVKQSRMYQLLGFSSFKHYVQERLGLPVSTVLQRTALEEKLVASPALQEARRQGLSYEKLRALSRLPEKEIGPWTPRAHALTCIALRRRLDAAHEVQMRAARKVTARLPMRVVTLLQAAIQSVRDLAGAALPAGACLAVICSHFTATWKDALPRRTPSQRLRERDGGSCTVPGCSRRSQDEHHILFRSQGGGDEVENKTGLCRFHHLRCIHAGHLRVVGRAPDGLTWFLGGKPWRLR